MTHALEEKFFSEADFACSEEMGLALLDYLSGYEEAIIIDSICTSDRVEGRVHHISLADFPPRDKQSSHYTGLPEAADLARKLNIPFPHQVHIIGIEVVESFAVTNSLSLSLKNKLPEILSSVENTVEKILHSERVTN